MKDPARDRADGARKAGETHRGLRRRPGRQAQRPLLVAAGRGGL